jgi:hypothetical protein
VVLADLARHAEQAVLHDVGDVMPSVQELVEAHRSGVPTEDAVHSLLFEIQERHYRLLLGLRRSRQWSTVRPRSFEAALSSLRRCFGVVVCDITADLEGERDAGSSDVEERNVMARTAVHAADVVCAVGRPGLKGVHSLVRVLGELVAAGVPAARVVPVVNGAPRHPKPRAEIVSALASLAPAAMGGAPLSPALFLPSRRVEEAWRDGAPLPAPLPSLLAAAYAATIDRLGRSAAIGREPELVVPGSLGSWATDA